MSIAPGCNGPGHLPWHPKTNPVIDVRRWKSSLLADSCGWERTPPKHLYMVQRSNPPGHGRGSAIVLSCSRVWYCPFPLLWCGGGVRCGTCPPPPVAYFVLRVYTMLSCMLTCTHNSLCLMRHSAWLNTASPHVKRLQLPLTWPQVSNCFQGSLNTGKATSKW